LDGTYRPARHDDRADGLPAVGDCKPTRELGKPGKKFFDTVVSSYPGGTLGASDAEALTQCCEWIDRINEIRRVERETGELATGAAATAAKQFMQFAVRFGLTPADRGKVKLAGATDGDQEQEKKFFGPRAKASRR